MRWPAAWSVRRTRGPAFSPGPALSRCVRRMPHEHEPSRTTHQRATARPRPSLAARERTATAELIAALSEVEARRLYLGLGYSSMFAFSTMSLRLSQSAASRADRGRARRRPVPRPSRASTRWLRQSHDRIAPGAASHGGESRSSRQRFTRASARWRFRSRHCGRLHDVRTLEGARESSIGYSPHSLSACYHR